jgi:hypothetical protein
VADINDRLDRLQRREEFDRFGRPIRATPAAEEPVEPVVTRPAGVDDRLGEVLDAVATVVRRHPGLSVMVAIADGRAGRPVVRVTERAGSVETGVVIAGSPAAVAAGPVDRAEVVPTAAAPARPVQRETLPLREPAFADAGTNSAFGPGGGFASSREIAAAREQAETAPYGRGLPAGDPVFEAGGRETPRGPAYGAVPRESSVPAGDPVFEPAGRDLMPSREHVNGRHAAPHDDEPGSGWSGSSWHNTLWSRERGPAGAGAPEPGPVRAGSPGGPARPGNPGAVRLVADGRPPLPEETSQTVTRLAQLLRENPTLASSWSRESAE